MYRSVNELQAVRRDGVNYGIHAYRFEGSPVYTGRGKAVVLGNNVGSIDTGPVSTLVRPTRITVSAPTGNSDWIFSMYAEY